MKLSFRFLALSLILAPGLRADPAHAAAMKDYVSSLGRLESVYVAVSTKKTPLKELETTLAAEKVQINAAADRAGVGADLATSLRACAALFDKTVQFMAKDTGEEEPRLWRTADDLAELTRLAKPVGNAVGAASRLTSAERRDLSAQVETNFGKKMIDFPRGDVAPFTSGSRSPFASAMWLVNLSFDETVNRTVPAATPRG